MLKNVTIPSSFLLIKKGNLSILLKEEYKELIGEREEEFKKLIHPDRNSISYFEGRMSHPSFSLKNGQRVVIRRYYHGGLLSFFIRDLYIFGSRSFEELILTEEIRLCGIPTIEPIGAIHQTIFPFFYKSFLISLKIPNVCDLKSFLIKIGNKPSYKNLVLKREIIRLVGKLIKKFHDKGFFHRDLQLKNILVAEEGKAFLLDFDRCHKKPLIAPDDRIKNILRLKRSAEKWKRTGLSITRTDQMRFFLSYTDGDITIRNYLKKTIRYYKLFLPFHKLVWFIKRI